MATSFFWTGPQSLEHAVTLTPWNTGLLVPSALSPTVYNYTVGASGLAVLPVSVTSGMSGGFAGSAEDAAGGAWLVGYHGDVTYISTAGSSTSYDTPTAASGEVFIGAAICNSSPYFVTANGDIYTVNGGAVVAVSPGFGEPVSSISADPSKLYAILPDSGNLATYSFSGITTGSFSTVTVPMEFPSFVESGATSGLAVGGYSNSTLPIGADAFQGSPYAPNYAAAVNRAANLVYLLNGTEPNWTVNSAVSGTGAPVDLAWASSGEQVLVADTAGNQIGVFNVVGGVLVLAQNVVVSGAVSLAATPDGNTALAMQPTENQVSVLLNTANLWSVETTVTINGANVAVGLSNTEFVVGGATSLTWLQSANNGWIAIGEVSGIAVTPSGLTTDGSGTIFATGSTGGHGYLIAADQSGVLATTNWLGAGDDVIFDQAQIAVADSANSMIRVFAFQGDSLVQQGTTPVPTGAKAFGSTAPSVWVGSSSGLAQFAFTSPFTIEPQPLGVFAIYRNSAWVSGATGVLNRPTAAAWDTSGSVWAATQNDMLDRFAMNAVAVSGITLAPYRATSAVPIGISKMLWWNNGLFAVSSMNSALMGVSGSASPGVPGVTPGVLLGINFILGISEYQ